MLASLSLNTASQSITLLPAQFVKPREGLRLPQLCAHSWDPVLWLEKWGSYDSPSWHHVPDTVARSITKNGGEVCGDRGMAPGVVMSL